ncbi:hypothetical protein [Actinokineospora inagensis]|uniref:hypothetical protein n=1 Tax=Actinokineospora inagensis TaxID=103730 RepID=UPI0003F624C4|nr:hypothetical protein [Actinokineospora inagensis]
MSTDDGVGAIGATMGQFAALAANGEFAVNEQGGQALLKAIRNLATWIDRQTQESWRLTDAAKLGSSNNAKVMTPYMQQVASDGQGFVTQIEQLRESLSSAAAAIEQAMANYQQTDHDSAVKLAGEVSNP